MHVCHDADRADEWRETKESPMAKYPRAEREIVLYFCGFVISCLFLSHHSIAPIFKDAHFFPTPRLNSQSIISKNRRLSNCATGQRVEYEMKTSHFIIKMTIFFLLRCIRDENKLIQPLHHDLLTHP